METLDRTRRVKDILWVCVFAGLLAMLFRFIFGLGATTNLDDHVPWGLWKIFNMVGGAALATSGFTIGFLGHVLHIKPFDRLVKPAILVAFLGYGSSLFALLFDIGLPWRFWHPFVFWNPHSFLFEVFWCVSFYFLVTFFELSPSLLERTRMTRLQHSLKKAAPWLVVIGITLSSLHHTSLGSLFLVTPQRLHVLWYSPMISLLFIISAMGGGMMLLGLIKLLYHWWYTPGELIVGIQRKQSMVCATDPESATDGEPASASPLREVRALAIAGSVVLTLYLILKLADLLLRPEASSALFEGTWESWLFLSEMLIATVLPIGLIFSQRVRHSANGLAFVCGLGASGLALNRMNVGIFGYFRDAGEVYFPSLIEWAITVGVLAMAGLAFFFIVEQFSIFTNHRKPVSDTQLALGSSFDRLTRVWNHRLLTGFERVTLIALIVLPISWWLLYPPYWPETPEPVSPPLALDSERDTLRIDANRNGYEVLFAHAEHRQRLGTETSCTSCHHLTLPGDQATPCSHCHVAMEERSPLFDHDHHTAAVAAAEQFHGLQPENQSCACCHTLGAYHAASTAKGCLECHREDMHPVDPPDDPNGLMHASSYHSAMHQTCIECHRKEKEAAGRPDLDRCTTCHQPMPGFKPRPEEGEKLDAASSLVELAAKKRGL